MKHFAKTFFIRLIRFAKVFTTNKKVVSVFAPESFGSVGDQAMIDVICSELLNRGLIPVVLYMPGWTPIGTRASCQSIVLRSTSNFSLQIWRIILWSRAAVVIGADVIDGAYKNGLPFVWLDKLVLGYEAGNQVGVINFSFSPDPDETLVRKISSSKGLIFTPRDPVSLARFASFTGQKGELAADLAFLLKPELRSESAKQAHEWLAARRAGADIVCFINLSGHTLSKMSGDGVASMASALRSWLRDDAGRSVLLIPHDFRHDPIGDVAALDRLNASLADEFGDRLEVLRPPFDAWDVKALCGLADVVVSGRMHLVIAALGMRVPTVSVVYVGKFEGLMQHVGLADKGLLLSTDEALDPASILSKVEKVLSERDRLKGIISKRHAEVSSLSIKNIEWLDTDTLC